MINKRFALTGATGLVGMNFLWEIVSRNINNLESIEIFVIGRGLENESLKKRILTLLKENGLKYISNEKDACDRIEAFFLNNVHYIEFDFLFKSQFDSFDFKKLSEFCIDYFYHIAASTDLRTGTVVEAHVLQTNIEGTRRLLHALEGIKIGLFSYVSTAYSCGNGVYEVDPEYINIHNQFRNPYEKSKLLTELLVQDFAREKCIDLKIFRPSIVGGRLSLPPIGHVNKFDVFYGWSAFFLALKYKKFGRVGDIYNRELKLDLRIAYSNNSGLNIVPVDYVSKSMYLISTNHFKGKAFHLVSKNELKHNRYIPQILSTLNITGVIRVDSVPNQKNVAEKFYYRTVGKVLTPYITSKPINFRVNNYEAKLLEYGVSVPTLTVDEFGLLLDFAKIHNFGL